MENIYKPEDYNSSEHIPISKYFSKFREDLKKNNVFNIELSNKTTNNEFENAFKVCGVDFTNTQKQFLIHACSIKNLDVEGEPEPIDTRGFTLFKLLSFYKFNEPVDAPHLKSVIALKNRTASQNTKFERGNSGFDLDIEPPLTETRDLSPGEDVVIYVTIHAPFKYIYGDKKCRQLRFFKSIAMLGSNTLADLRDKINCPGDIAVCKESSENPDFAETSTPATDAYPSGFFFIDSVFYNDFRHERAKDYSEVIRKWALEKRIGNFTTAVMENTKINTLTPRINYPYLYLHKVCCEHLFIFTHMRLLNSEDCLESAKYPYYSSVGRLRDKYCVICGVQPSSWLVVDCDRLPQNQAMLCGECFKSYLYIGDKKIGNFKAYPYHHTTSVL